MAKQPLIFFMSGEGGRLCKDGVKKNEARDFNFKFRPFNSFRTREANGVPKFTVVHVDKSVTQYAPVEGCFIVFSDTSGDKLKTQEFFSVFITQLGTAEARATLAEGQAAQAISELTKLKTQARIKFEEDADFTQKLQRRGPPRREALEGIGPKRIRTALTPEELEQYEEESEE